MVVLCVFCYCVLPAAVYFCCFQAFKAMFSPTARNTTYPANNNNPRPVVMTTQNASTPTQMEGNPGMATTQTSTGPVVIVPQGQSPPQQQVIYQQAPIQGQQQVVYQQPQTQGQPQVVYQQPVQQQQPQQASAPYMNEAPPSYGVAPPLYDDAGN